MRYEDALLILDLVDSGVIMLDKNQKVIFWNQFVSSTSQIPFSTIENKHWLDVFPMLEHSRIAKAVEKAVLLNFPSILSYKLLKHQFPLYKKSLATKPPYLIVQSIIMKPLMEGGKNNGCIIYINDVSASSKREEDLNNQSIELREVIRSYTEVKSQFEEVFASAHNGIIVFDINGSVVNINEAALELFDCRTDDMTERNIVEFLPDLKQYYYDNIQQKYTFTPDADHEFEQEIVSPVKKCLSVTVSQMRGGDSDFFVFITDITERKRVEKELLSANSELEEFAYRTSHDLRSPIVSSVGLIKIAQESIDQEETERVKSCLDHADKSLRKLELLIRDILKLTETQKMQEDDREIDIQEIIHQAFSGMSELSGFHKIHKELNLQHDKPLVTKKSRFNMILENLISNSIKYHDPDIDKPFIRLDTKIQNSNFILDVIDNGLGIPEEQQKKLFQMFNRFHPKTAFGSGLGLYLMKKSAHVMGGDIEYIQQPKGACFRLTIPQSQKLH